MASGSFRKLISFSLIMAFALAAIPSSVRAAPVKEYIVKEHVFKFYLDPALVPDLDFAKRVLPKYVADMNTILEKNTSRRLVFDPEIDIILMDIQPHTNVAFPPLPVVNFEIWAHAVRTNFLISNSGYAGVDESGAGVLAGLKWTKIYDPDNLISNEINDYWTQIHLMLHEMAHIFGAGYGEYYNLFNIPDTTGVSPLLNINIYDRNDKFWSDKPDFMTDPLLRNPVKFEFEMGVVNRENLLEYVQFSKLTAAIISNDFRNLAPTVDFSNIKVRIVSEDGLPIESANIKIWSIVGTTPYQSQLMVDDFTDADGSLTFSWGGAHDPHNSNDLLRLIKVYRDGYEASAKYVSIYDTDITRLVNNNGNFEITIALSKLPTFADVPADYFAWSSIEKLYKAGITGGCSTSPLRYCPNEIVTRAQMAVFLERSINGFSFSPLESTGKFLDTNDHWARNWIDALVSDGITNGCGNGNYCPDAPVTRAQMAVFLLRSMHGVEYTPPTATGTMFQDVSLNHWAADWIEQLGTENITSGCGNGSYCPDVQVTRAQMAVFLVRVFNFP